MTPGAALVWKQLVLASNLIGTRHNAHFIAGTVVGGTGSLTSLCSIREQLEARMPSCKPALTSCWSMLFLKEAKESSQNWEWSQLILCDLSLGALDWEWLLHLFGESLVPECEMAALSEPKGGLRFSECLSAKAGGMACSSRYCFR